ILRLSAERLLLPDFPGTLDRAGVGGRGTAAFLVAEELDRPLELHGLQLQARVHLGIDRAEYRFLDRRTDDRHAMSAHKHAVALAERPGERLAERTDADQQVVLLAHLECPTPVRPTR